MYGTQRNAYRILPQCKVLQTDQAWMNYEESVIFLFFERSVVIFKIGIWGRAIYCSVNCTIISLKLFPISSDFPIVLNLFPSMFQR